MPVSAGVAEIIARDFVMGDSLVQRDQTAAYPPLGLRHNVVLSASGRPLHHLARQLAPTALGPFSRPILLDPAAVSGLIDAALTVLEAGIDVVTEEDEEW